MHNYLLLTYISWAEKIKIRFLNIFMILLPILWYEYSVPWRRNREKICLRTFCMPFATLMIIKTTFWEISKSLLTKYRETIDRFCTNQLDKVCQITVSLLWNNSTYILSLCKIKAIPAISMKRPFLMCKISTLDVGSTFSCWNSFLPYFMQKNPKNFKTNVISIKSFIPIYCTYSIHL